MPLSSRHNNIHWGAVQDDNENIMMMTTSQIPSHHSICHHGNEDHENNGDHEMRRYIPSMSDLSLINGQQIGNNKEEIDHDTRLTSGHNCRTSNNINLAIPLRSSLKNQVIQLNQEWNRRGSTATMMIIFVFMSILLLPSCSSFNLEPRLPIIKRGQDNSYFGYSVAQHIIQDETRGRIIDTV